MVFAYVGLGTLFATRLPFNTREELAWVLLRVFLILNHETIRIVGILVLTLIVTFARFR